MRLVRCLTGLVLGCVTCLAQTGVTLSAHSSTALIEARAAVRRYCEMDARGFRLAGNTSKQIQTLTLEPLPEERQGFDVIEEFQIDAAKSNARGILVTVDYKVLGRFEAGDGYTPEPHLASLQVQTVQDGDNWKLAADDDLLTPRIGRGPVLKWLKEQLAAEKDPSAKRTLEDSIKQLEQDGN